MNNTHNTENRSVLGIFFVKKNKKVLKKVLTLALFWCIIWVQ